MKCFFVLELGPRISRKTRTLTLSLIFLSTHFYYNITGYEKIHTIRDLNKSYRLKLKSLSLHSRNSTFGKNIQSKAEKMETCSSFFPFFLFQIELRLLALKTDPCLTEIAPTCNESMIYNKNNM